MRDLAIDRIIMTRRGNDTRRKGMGLQQQQRKERHDDDEENAEEKGG